MAESNFDVTRREFLKLAAVTGAGLTLGGCSANKQELAKYPEDPISPEKLWEKYGIRVVPARYPNGEKRVDVDFFPAFFREKRRRDYFRGVTKARRRGKQVEIYCVLCNSAWVGVGAMDPDFVGGHPEFSGELARADQIGKSAYLSEMQAEVVRLGMSRPEHVSAQTAENIKQLIAAYSHLLGMGDRLPQSLYYPLLGRAWRMGLKDGGERVYTATVAGSSPEERLVLEQLINDYPVWAEKEGIDLDLYYPDHTPRTQASYPTVAEYEALDGPTYAYGALYPAFVAGLTMEHELDHNCMRGGWGRPPIGDSYYFDRHVGQMKDEYNTRGRYPFVFHYYLPDGTREDCITRNTIWPNKTLQG